MRRRRPAARTVLAVAALGSAVAFIDATIDNIAFPDIERSFPGTSISSVSWVLNAYNILFAAFLVAAGRIADVLGRRRFPADRRSLGVALLSAVAAAAAGLGPSLGGLLVAADDWRAVFLVNLSIGSAAIVLARQLLVESRAPGRRTLLAPVGSHVLCGTSWKDDMARMARRLSGRSIGIMLARGGARAFSHVGVLEELTAAGLLIDRVAGVSMGAFVGALYVIGLDPHEIDGCCFEEWVQRRPLSDYTIPRHSLIRGEHFRSMLHRTFEQRTIEELPRSFMCGCTEVRGGRLVMARYGPLWETVGFSICLPIIAPPQVRGRDIFIDGSLVDNLPVAAMAQVGEGPVIAVDVKTGFDRDARRPDDDGASRASRPGTHRTPSLGETLTRVLLLGTSNTSVAAGRHADLVIKPQAHGVGLLEFPQIDAAREAGRAAARQALETSSTALLS